MGRKFDRLSNLPLDVLEQILSCLPIKDAVKTSVLSSNWRYKSAMLPHLVFDDRCISSNVLFLSVDSSSSIRTYNSLMLRPLEFDDHMLRFDERCVSARKQAAIVKIVDHVLLSHIGPIHKFKLSHHRLEATSDIDRWILHLSRNSIKEFILEIWTLRRYSIPSCLFSCRDIVHLELYHCLLKLPPKFKGFRSLKSMDFQLVHLSQDVLENMIVCCPLLEKLTLANCDGFTRFKIHAPNLQIFDLEGDYEDFILENTSNLAQVCIDLDVKQIDQRQILDSNSSNLLKFFADLPNIRRLKIQSCFLKVIYSVVSYFHHMRI